MKFGGACISNGCKMGSRVRQQTEWDIQMVTRAWQSPALNAQVASHALEEQVQE